ncbi:MAG: hypothetical protein ACPGGK_08130 [Pikeienuella sp.]
MSISNIMITVGIVCAITGLAGLVYCINLARQVKRGDWPEDKLQTALIRMSAVNMASMGGAMMGLAILLVGLILD